MFRALPSRLPSQESDSKPRPTWGHDRNAIRSAGLLRATASRTFQPRIPPDAGERVHSPGCGGTESASWPSPIPSQLTQPPITPPPRGRRSDEQVSAWRQQAGVDTGLVSPRHLHVAPLSFAFLPFETVTPWLEFQCLGSQKVSFLHPRKLVCLYFYTSNVPFK